MNELTDDEPRKAEVVAGKPRRRAPTVQQIVWDGERGLFPKSWSRGHLYRLRSRFMIEIAPEFLEDPPTLDERWQVGILLLELKEWWGEEGAAGVVKSLTLPDGRVKVPNLSRWRKEYPKSMPRYEDWIFREFLSRSGDPVWLNAHLRANASDYYFDRYAPARAEEMFAQRPKRSADPRGELKCAG